MLKQDVFAFGKSNLNAFLFASVGTEVNGSSLTVLSTLARLGEDPWLKAASWARMSRAGAAAGLAASIGGMPLRPKDLEAAPSTAEHLVELLFASGLPEVQAPGRPRLPATLKPISIAFAYLAIIVAFLLTMAFAQSVYSIVSASLVPVKATQTVRPGSP